MATVRDHRRHADLSIPRGTYAQARAAATGTAPPVVTASVFQRVRASVPGSTTSTTGTTSGTTTGTTTGGPVVRDHRQHTAPFGTTRRLPGLPTGRVRFEDLGHAAGGILVGTGGAPATQQSTVNAVPGLPPGFGTTISWVGEEDLAVVAFVTASDLWGVGVSGVTDGDTFELVNAVGNATFSQETDNAGVAGIVTIVAAGAALTAAAFGAPELAPLINGAGAAVAGQFPEQKHNAKSRDAFGQVAGSDEFARQEGGLLVCSPNAQGIFESGDSDHTNRWTKSHADRHDDHRPDHVFSAFFLQRDHERRMLDGDGDLIICPWDHQFDDNVGVYRVEFLLRRGERPPVG